MIHSKNNTIKKSTLFIIVLIVIFLIIGIFYLILVKFENKRTDSKAIISSENTSVQVETKSLNTKRNDQNEQIFGSTSESSNNTTKSQNYSNNITGHYTFNEKMAFVPDEFEKVQNFFGPLPEIKQNHQFEHTKINAIYVNDIDYLESYFEMVKGSEVNTFIIDVKESWGLLYESQIPLAKELNATMEKRNLPDIFRRCHEHGIRVIARIVCFKDSTMANVRPDLTIATEDDIPIEFPLEGYQTFANPYEPKVWQYLIDIATEVIQFGADEIQFDYVRFPSGQPEGETIPYFGEPDKVPQKYSAINRFLQTAVVEIQENQNIPVGADLFSIVMTSNIDGQAIGQFWNFIGLSGIDNICPMIYPSHYANASTGGVLGNGEGTYLGNNLYEAPDLEPYNVVMDAFVDGMPAIQQEGYAHVRPYLQAFTAEYLPEGYYKEYTAQEIHEQIQAAHDSGFDEWILWNVKLDYPKGTFLPKE